MIDIKTRDFDLEYFYAEKKVLMAFIRNQPTCDICQ